MPSTGLVGEKLKPAALRDTYLRAVEQGKEFARNLLRRRPERKELMAARRVEPARVEGVAAGQPACREPGPLRGAVPLERPRQADGSARTHFSITEA